MTMQLDVVTWGEALALLVADEVGPLSMGKDPAIQAEHGNVKIAVVELAALMAEFGIGRGVPLFLYEDDCLLHHGDGFFLRRELGCRCRPNCQHQGHQT